MNALLATLPICLVLFFLTPKRSLKRFLILSGIVTIPFETTYSFVTLGARSGWVNGIQISLSEVLFIIVFGYLLVKRQVFYSSRKMMVPLALFICACTLSLINSRSGTLTLWQVIMMGQLGFLYYYVFSNAIETEEDVELVLRSFRLALILQGGIACAQVFSGQSLDYFSTGYARETLMRVGEEWSRAQGTTPEPNSFAAYLVPLIVMNISIKGRTRGEKRLRQLASCLGVLALLFSFSRGGWTSCSVALMFYLYYGVRRGLLDRKRVVRVVLVMALVAAAFWPLIAVRIFGDDHNAAMSRVPLIELAFNMIRAHPLLGIGANTFGNEIRNYVTPDLLGLYLYEVHNMYLLVWAETGLVGLAAFVLFLVTLIKPRRSAGLSLVRQEPEPEGTRRKGADGLVRYLGLGVYLGVVAMAVHMMVDIFNSRVLLASLLVLAGLITASERLALKEGAASKPLDGRLARRVSA